MPSTTRRRTEVPPQPPYGSTRSNGRVHPNATRMSGRQEPKPERREVPNPRSAELVSQPIGFVRETDNYVIFDLGKDLTDLFIVGRDGLYVPKAWLNSAENELEFCVRRVKKQPAQPAAKKPAPATKAAPKSRTKAA